MTVKKSTLTKASAAAKAPEKTPALKTKAAPSAEKAGAPAETPAKKPEPKAAEKKPAKKPAAKKKPAARKTAAKAAAKATKKSAEKKPAKKRAAARKEPAKLAAREEPAKLAAREEPAKLSAKEEPAKLSAREVAKLAEEKRSRLETKTAGQIAPPDEKLKVLFVSPEVQPFAGTGGLGEVAGSLPKELNRLGIDCRVVLPLYGSVSQEYRSRMKFLGHKDIPVAWRKKYMGVFSLQHEGVTVYFIDNEEYFRRDGLYGYYDDCERFAFFSRAVLESMEFTGFNPDIIHANDWQTAMVPVYQDALYHREYCTTVFTIHNVEYQGRYGTEVISDVLGLPEGAAHLVEYNGDVNLMKGGIQTANLVSTVSPSYAEELKDPACAFGLDGMIRACSYKLRGILNGISTDVYDPADDPYIPACYSPADLSGKKECKRAFQEMAGLPQRDVPLIVLISRLVTAKGIDLMTPVMDDVLSGNDVQFAVLGTGYHFYEDYFRGLADRHPDRARAFIEFNKGISHQLYAAGDILLMPSKGEPCGLSQMIACRYGTVPVVRATGGLRDSISDCTLGEGNGFVFDSYDTDGFYHALMNAVSRFHDTENWQNLVRYDLTRDFSWSRSAEQYRDMYEQVRFH